MQKVSLGTGHTERYGKWKQGFLCPTGTHTHQSWHMRGTSNIWKYSGRYDIQLVTQGENKQTSWQSDWQDHHLHNRLDNFRRSLLSRAVTLCSRLPRPFMDLVANNASITYIRIIPILSLPLHSFTQFHTFCTSAAVYGCTYGVRL